MIETSTLVEQAAQGDAMAFGQLVSRYRRLVYAICLSRVRAAAEAEDLAQEVFVRAYQDLKNLREPKRFLPWLRVVANNVCRMWRRRQRPVSVPLEAVAERDDRGAAARLKRSELAEVVSGMLSRLSPKSRDVLALHHLGGCSEAETAAVLGLSPATVKARLHEARRQAKRSLLPVIRELLSLHISSEDLVKQIMARCGSPGCICPDTLTEGR